MFKLSKNAIVNRIHNYNNVSKKFCQTFSNAKPLQPEQSDDNTENVWKSAKPYSSIPGPSVLQMLIRILPGGKYHNIDLFDWHGKVRDEFGEITKLPGLLGNKEILMISDPNDFELVFRNEGQWPIRRNIATFDHYRKVVRPDVFKNVGSLINEQGESWAKIRSVVSPLMLKPSIVNAYIPDVDKISIEFSDRIHKLRDNKNELPADFLYELNKWALEVVASIAVDQRLNILDCKKGDKSNKASQLIKSVNDFFNLTYHLEMGPHLWKYIKTLKYRQLMKVFDDLTDSTMYFVNSAIEKFEKNPNFSSGEKCLTEKILKIDKQIAIVMALDMFMAGVDTTASAVSNFMYHLAKNPEKQEILRKEVQNLSTDSNGILTEKSLQSAPYLRASLKEALRLTTIIVGTSRATGRDLVMKGYQVPKGTDVVLVNVRLNRDPKYYKSPNDFMPERWLRENVPNACPDARTSNAFVYLPFGFGPRSCIGKRFAEMEIYVLIARLLKKYRIEYDYPPFKYRNSFVLSPTSDLKFKLTEI